MEGWYSMVRKMKDESEQPYFTETFTHQIFHELSRMRIKEKVKFRERMGAEYEQWIEELAKQYDPDFIREILEDDEFWLLTLKLTHAV